MHPASHGHVGTYGILDVSCQLLHLYRVGVDELLLSSAFVLEKGSRKALTHSAQHGVMHTGALYAPARDTRNGVAHSPDL